MSMPSPAHLTFNDVDKLSDQMLTLMLAAARPFKDMIVVNSTSATLVVVSDIDRIDHATIVDLCRDLQANNGEAGVLACQWSTITDDELSVYTWIGVDPNTVHTSTVNL